MQLAVESMQLLIIVSAPVLLASMIVGLVISIIQTTTSIQEQTLTFVPKVLAILAVLGFFGYWMIAMVANYTMELFRRIPDLAR